MDEPIITFAVKKEFPSFWNQPPKQVMSPLSLTFLKYIIMM